MRCTYAEHALRQLRGWLSDENGRAWRALIYSFIPLSCRDCCGVISEFPMQRLASIPGSVKPLQENNQCENKKRTTEEVWKVSHISF